MRIHEIIVETSNSDDLNSVLVDTLMFMKNQAMTEIETLALISMVQRNGLDSFNYEALLRANEENPLVQNLIKSIDPRKVKMAADASTVVNDNGEEARGAGSADTVGNMASKALQRRS